MQHLADENRGCSDIAVEWRLANHELKYLNRTLVLRDSTSDLLLVPSCRSTICTYHAAHTPWIDPKILLIFEDGLRRSNSQWCVERVGNIVLQERLTKVYNLDVVERCQRLCRKPCRTDEIVRTTYPQWFSIFVFDQSDFKFSDFLDKFFSRERA